MKSKMRKLTLMLSLCLIASLLQAQTIGGPNWRYDATGKVNSFYEPKQKQWATAGVVGGIRNPASRSRNVLSSDSQARIQTKIDNLSRDGGGVLKFPAGTFPITSTLKVKKNVVLQGASSGTTILKDNLSTNNSTTPGTVILFENLTTTNGHNVGGIRKMTLKGPLSGTPNKANFSRAKPNHRNKMVNFLRSENLFLDNVKIINSGDTPFTTFNSDGKGHHTLRNTTINGCWNKGGGGEGYVNISSGYCLIYKCTIKYVRHFALQQSGSRYNVVYDNTIVQDVNFHNDDSGNNLIEKNRITIEQSIIPSNRYVVMGPWSKNHDDSRADNYVYNNTVSEFGRSNPRCRNKARVYKGARGKEPNKQPGNNPFSASESIGTGKRLYSVKNGSSHNRMGNKVEAEIERVTEIGVYPNPVDDVLNLKFKDDINEVKVRIIDMLGKTVLDENVSHTSPQLYLSKINRGSYYVQVFSLENDMIKTIKLVKN